MKFIDGGSEYLLHDSVQLKIELRCDVCGHILKSKVSGERNIRVLPCENCIEHHATSHSDWLKAAQANHDEVRAKRLRAEEVSFKKLEDSIYAKFEARFKELMKVEQKE